MIDELSTYIGVNFLGYHEFNNITRYLMSVNDYVSILILDFFVIPLCIYGTYSFYRLHLSERLSSWIPYGLLLAYVPVLINNLYLIAVKL